MISFEELKNECLQDPEEDQEYEKVKQLTPEGFQFKMEELAKSVIAVDDQYSFPTAKRKREAINTAHREADALMCSILTEFGYGEGVAIFKRMMKHTI